MDIHNPYKKTEVHGHPQLLQKKRFKLTFLQPNLDSKVL